VLRRGVGRQRLLEQLRRALPDALLRIANNNTLEIRWLTPRRHLIVNPVGGEAQDCILASFVLAWPVHRRDVGMWSAWAAEFPDHACARFLQRSDSNDLKAALLAAGQAFMVADAGVLYAICWSLSTPASAVSTQKNAPSGSRQSGQGNFQIGYRMTRRGRPCCCVAQQYTDGAVIGGKQITARQGRFRAGLSFGS
jgi:hypothetical protein